MKTIKNFERWSPERPIFRWHVFTKLREFDKKNVVFENYCLYLQQN